MSLLAFGRIFDGNRRFGFPTSKPWPGHRPEYTRSMYPMDLRHAERSDPLAIILSGRQQQRAFCDDLETIADQLLDRMDTKFCAELLDIVCDGLPLFQRDEEALYEIIRTRNEGNNSLARWIDQVITEHRRNDDYALELADPLSDLAAGRCLENVQATGYLFRCTFEAIRHHLAWEEITFFSDTFEPLTAAEDALLSAAIAKHRKVRSSKLRIVN